MKNWKIIKQIFFPSKRKMKVDILISLISGVIITIIIMFPIDGSELKAVIYGITSSYLIFGALMFYRTKSIAFEAANFIAAVLMFFLFSSFESGYFCGMIAVAAMMVGVASGVGLFIKSIR